MSTGRLFELFIVVTACLLATVLWAEWMLYNPELQNTEVRELSTHTCVVDTYDDGEQVWQCDDGCYFKGRVRPGRTPRLNCPEEKVRETD